MPGGSTALCQRCRFYKALALLVDMEDWSALEYIEAELQRRRGEILAQRLRAMRNEPWYSDRSRLFMEAFGDQEPRIIE